MPKLRTAIALTGCAAVWASTSCGNDGVSPVSNSGGSANGGDAGKSGETGAGGNAGAAGSESGGSTGNETGGADMGGADTGGADTGGGGGAGGDCGWTFTVGGTYDSENYATDVMALDDGSVVVVGVVASAHNQLGAGSGAFALRLSQQGSLLWSQAYPGVLGGVRVAEGHGGKLVVVGTADSGQACAEQHGYEDAWVAELSKDDGTLLAKKCIGGTEDDTGRAVVARGSGGSAHYFITGTVASHQSGNVGPNNNGGNEQPDALLGYWELASDTATGICFGSNNVDGGATVLGKDLVFVNGSGNADPGDYGSEGLGGADFAAIELSPNAVCTSKPCGTVTRFGGPSDEVVSAAAGTKLAGLTSSNTGDVGCPNATDTANSVWVGTYSNGTVSSHGCLHSGGTLRVADVAQISSTVALTGAAKPATGGDFASATVEGTLSGDASYIALYDGSFASPKELVVVGDQTTFHGVALRPDGCVVAVGSRAGDTSGSGVFVYTR